MVGLVAEWQRAMELGRSGAVAMPGEDGASGARASPLVGYLGKVQERVGSLDQCPWCASKDRSSTLRSYRLSLHESVTLCPEPQCLFPLVSCPLEDIMARLVPAAPNGKPSEDQDDSEQVKRLRSDQLRAAEESCPDRDNGRTGSPLDGICEEAPCLLEEIPPSLSSITSPTEEDSNDLRRLEGSLEEHVIAHPEETVISHVQEAVNANLEEPIEFCFDEAVDAPFAETVDAHIEEQDVAPAPEPVDTTSEESESLLILDNSNQLLNAPNPALPIPAQEMQLPENFSAAVDVSTNEHESRHDEANVTTTGTHEDVSIGPAALLETFHGLSHDDIITLTLEEIQTQPAVDHEALPDRILIPDSSSEAPKDAGEDKDLVVEQASEESGKQNKGATKVKRQPMRKCRRKAQEVDAPDSPPPPPPVVQTAPHVSSTEPPPPSDPNSRWSYMLGLLPANQKRNAVQPPPTPVEQARPLPSHATSEQVKRPAVPTALFTKRPRLLHAEDDDDDGLPLKAAGMFCAFTSPVQTPPPFPKSPQSRNGGNICLTDTDSLRHKLLKKLKAKKKKLAKLNQLLAHQPDSTATVSPVNTATVSPVSTHGSVFSSAAASPDSSGFLDLLAGHRDGTPDMPHPQTDNFLDEILLTTRTEAQRAMENEALRELELFLS
ncbi:SUMO-specific isopeptidase USPL1 [Stigmatopora argus]